jgi:hypothetical protein
VGAGFAALYQGQFKRAPRRIIADLGAFEKANNPTGDEIDTNPFGLLRDGDRWIVADAGANALLEVHPNGHVKTLAIFPNRMVEAPPFLGLPPGTKIPMDEVPTSVVKGPDGAYYVGQLTGFPFPVDGARVYRITPGADPATAAEVYAEGFTNIIDIAFGPNGRLYVLEIFKNGLLSGDLTGALIRVNADGSQTLITDQLTAPGGLAIARNGTFYVSNKTIFAGKGELLQIKP